MGGGRRFGRNGLPQPLQTLSPIWVAGGISCVTRGSKRRNDAFTAILCSVMNILTAIEPLRCGRLKLRSQYRVVVLVRFIRVWCWNGYGQGMNTKAGANTSSR